MTRLGWVVSLALLTACAAPEAVAPRPSGASAASRDEVAHVLDAFHAAAARSDEEAYFSLFAKEGVFLGTDAKERWGVAEFRAYAHPHFEKKRGWVMRATKRNVSFTNDGTAYFDEDLETKNLGPARGTGVLVREGKTYKVLQYNLTITVPNEQFSSVKRALAAAGLPSRYEADPHPLVFRDPGRGAAIAALGAKVGEIVDREMSDTKPPSLAVAIVADGKVVHTIVRGEADKTSHTKATASTLYRVGSITKTFTATAALALRDEGKLNLDDRADIYVPEMGKVVLVPTDTRAITLRQLLSHTSGLARLGDFDYTRPDHDVEESEILKALDTRVDHAPGTAYLYSNFGMSLVGLVLGKLEKKPFRDIVHARLFAPLGMTSATFAPNARAGAPVATGYEKNDTTTPAVPWRLGASEAAGGLYASLDDMGKWIAFQEEAWPARDAKDDGPVKRASLREAHVQGVPSDFEVERTKDGTTAAAEGVGLAWHVRRTCDFSSLVEHGGAIDGFHANVSFAPDRGLGVVVLSNSIAARTSIVESRIWDTIAKVSALDPREHVFAHEAKVQTWLDALGTSSTAIYEATFDKGFREHVPQKALDEALAPLQKRHGKCKLAKERTRAASADEASLYATCERGALRIHAHATGAAFSGFTVSSTGFPVTANVTTRARDILALAKRWDETRALTLFTNDTKLGLVRSRLATFAESHGVCTLGAGSGNSVASGRFALVCPYGRPFELEVDLEKSDKISTFTLTKPENERGSCH